MLQLRRQPGWTHVRTTSVVEAAVNHDARLMALQITSVVAVQGGQAVSVTKLPHAAKNNSPSTTWRMVVVPAGL